MYSLEFDPQTKKQLKKIIKNKKQYLRLWGILESLKKDPYATTHKFEKLRYQAYPVYSKRLNKKDRILYRVEEQRVVVVIISVLGHYGDK